MFILEKRHLERNVIGVFKYLKNYHAGAKSDLFSVALEGRTSGWKLQASKFQLNILRVFLAVRDA